MTTGGGTDAPVVVRRFGGSGGGWVGARLGGGWVGARLGGGWVGARPTRGCAPRRVGGFGTAAGPGAVNLTGLRPATVLSSSSSLPDHFCLPRPPDGGLPVAPTRAASS